MEIFYQKYQSLYQSMCAIYCQYSCAVWILPKGICYPNTEPMKLESTMIQYVLQNEDTYKTDFSTTCVTLSAGTALV